MQRAVKSIDTTATKTPASIHPMSSIAALRASARRKIEDGAVTAGYTANRELVLKMLNEALATEIVCMLRYKRHYFMADGINAGPVADEFLQHANEELVHADQIRNDYFGYLSSSVMSGVVSAAKNCLR